MVLWKGSHIATYILDIICIVPYNVSVGETIVVLYKSRSLLLCEKIEAQRGQLLLKGHTA